MLGERAAQLHVPAGLGAGVVVDEGDDVPGGHGDAGIAGAREPGLLDVQIAQRRQPSAVSVHHRPARLARGGVDHDYLDVGADRDQRVEAVRQV
jgi:hypothetical protein